MPIGGCQHDKCKQKTKEDGNEDDVSPEGADKIDEAPMKRRKKPKLAWKPGLVRPSAGWFAGAYSAYAPNDGVRVAPKVNQKPPACVSTGRQNSLLSKSGFTKWTEDDERKGVSKEEFEDTAETHEETPDEVVSSHGSDPVSTSTSPAHQLTRQRAKTEEEAKKGQWRRVAEFGLEITLGGMLRIKVEFLEEFGACGNVVCGAHLVPRLIRPNITTKLIWRSRTVLEILMMGPRGLIRWIL